MKNLYIDIGSTNIKSREDGGNVERIPFPAPLLNANGRYEVNPSEIIGAIKRVVDSSSAERIFFPRRCTAIFWRTETAIYLRIIFPGGTGGRKRSALRCR